MSALGRQQSNLCPGGSHPQPDAKSLLIEQANLVGDRG
jgi:hypothetical protein